MRAERVKELKEAKDQAETKSKKQIEENNKKIQALQKRVCFKDLSLLNYLSLAHLLKIQILSNNYTHFI